MRVEDKPEFGPRGYLPERAAKRARKIMLREQMGLGWPLAALLAALLVGGAGLWYVTSASQPPGPPFVAVGDLQAVAPGEASVLGGVLVVRATATVTAFSPDASVTWCTRSARLESASGQVWTADGRLVGGDGTSLSPLPVTVFDGVVYVDRDHPGPPLPPQVSGEQPVCT
jgi:hypothetical protein